MYLCGGKLHAFFPLAPFFLLLYYCGLILPVAEGTFSDLRQVGKIFDMSTLVCDSVVLAAARQSGHLIENSFSLHSAPG